MADVELLLDGQYDLGEGPMWSVIEQALYWVNIPAGEVHRLDPASGAHEQFEVGQEVGAVVLRQSGGLMLAMRSGLYAWSKDGGLELIAAPEADKPDNRFNDGAVDRQGRFWAGTMSMVGGTKVGSLYRLDADHRLHTMQTGVTTSNGLGWSPDNRYMYYCDTRPRTIYRYDFDPATGDIENRQDFIVVEDVPGEGGPDGLTVDSEGFIWSARWGGWKICRYDPDGKLEREVKIPSERVTSVIFGGPELEDLYITTARQGYDPARDAATQPHAGGIFHLRPGVKGMPEPEYGG